MLPIYNSPILNLGKVEDDVELDPSIIFSTNIPRFKDFLDKFRYCKRFALDIETISYHFTSDGSVKNITNGALDPFQNDIRLLQIGLDNGDVLIIDLGGYNKRVPRAEEEELLADFFKIFISHLEDNAVRILGQNLKFDITTLMVKLGGLKVTQLNDLYLMSKIYWSGVGIKKVGKSENRSERGIKGFHSLGKICERLGITIDKTEQVSDWSKAKLSNKQLNYACNDVKLLFSAYDKLRALVIKDNLTIAIKAEFDFLSALCSIQYNGYPVNKQRTEEYIEQYQIELDKCEAEWRKYAGSLDIQKTAKDIIPFFQSLGIEIDSSAKDSLALVDHPAAKALLEYRGLKKSLDYLSTVYKKASLSEESKLGFRIRSSYNQIATAWRTSSTGKISGTNFATGRKQTTELPLCINLQQIPNLSSTNESKGLPNIRNIFGVDEDRKIIIADLSQAHSRIATQMFKDSTQLAIYNEGKDGHLLVATKILEAEGYNLTFEEVSDIFLQSKSKEKLNDLEKKIKYARQQGKTGFYSFLNQAGAKTMQLSFKGYGIDVSEEFCKNLIKILREIYGGLYQGIKTRMEEINSGVEYDFSEYTDLEGKPVEGKYGVVRGLPCLKLNNSSSRNFSLKTKRTHEYFNSYKNKMVKETKNEVAFTDTISFLWLSTEAIIIKNAVGEIHKKLILPQNDHWEGKIINMVHDQVDLECRAEYSLEVATLVGTEVKKSLEMFIDCIPVEETNTDYSKWIASSMGELH